MPDLPSPVASAIDEAVERIGTRFHGHEVVLRQMLASPITTAYHTGRNDAIREHRTTADVAADLGITRRHLQTIAREMNVGTVLADVRLFLPEDVEALRNRRDGRRRTG